MLAPGAARSEVLLAPGAARFEVLLAPGAARFEVLLAPDSVRFDEACSPAGAFGVCVLSSPPMTRTATVERNTSETQIRVTLDLDGTGSYRIDTPTPFLSHMLEQLSRHGLFDLTIDARGDTHIDDHHVTEDLGISVGKAFAEALGNKRGIRRYGSATLPMDEALVTCAIDLSGRPFFVWKVPLPKAKVGTFDVELCEVFFEGFVRGAQCNLHVHLHEGTNLHHIIEISFKALARSLRAATELDPRADFVPSTKGTLSE